MYRFKFNRKESIADFFARQMSLSVKQSFNGIEFDLVCPVPLTLKSELKRGYNQSSLLGERLAEYLDIPYFKNLLICKGKRKHQYKLRSRERHENVKDIYFSDTELKGQTVLLVDDIKTSGYTLDECSKALLKAGARRVYCVTGLITLKKTKGQKVKHQSYLTD